MRIRSRIFISLLFMVLAVTQAAAQTEISINTILDRYTAKKELNDWEAIALGINGKPIKTPLLTTPYFKRLEKEVKAAKGEYKLVTDYARIVLVYKSHGKDPTKIAGYNFIDKITGFENMEKQGINAYIWSLIALYGQKDTVTMPLVESMLKYQLPGGGFTLSKSAANASSKPDADLTAMAVTALAPYKQDKTVKTAVDNAVNYLSGAQLEDGTYKTNNVSNAESVSQVIIALCAAGVSPLDTRFIKNNISLMDALDSFRQTDGSYAHVLNGSETKADPVASRQAVLAISAYNQALRYDALSAEERNASGRGRGLFEFYIKTP